MFATLSYPIYHFEPPLVKPNVEFYQHYTGKNGAKTRHEESLSGFNGNTGQTMVKNPINELKMRQFFNFDRLAESTIDQPPGLLKKRNA